MPKINSPRPYVLFTRTVNPGQRDRNRQNRETKEVETVWKGEHVRDWRRYVVDEISGSPYVWATAAYFSKKISDPNWRPIGVGDFEVIATNGYPESWRTQLQGVLAAVNPAIKANAELAKANKQIEELKAEATPHVQSKTELGAKKAIGGKTSKGRDEALSAAGSAAERAAS